MRRLRNCGNQLNLSEESRAFEKSTEWQKWELTSKNATKVHTLGRLRLYECPLTYITRDTASMVKIGYLAEVTNKLYYSGGWGDQPSWFVTAFEMLKVEVSQQKGKDNG